MNKHEIINRIESLAPLETQEKWDCSGWLIETQREEVSKVMLCLTVTDDVVRQARERNCDMIISHHPLFCVPIFAPSLLEGEGWGEGLIDIYCAHTNLDKAKGGTTDILINNLGLDNFVIASECEAIQPFVRYINYETSVNDFLFKLKEISPNLRYVNNFGVEKLRKVAFCAGSGSEFIQEAYENGADALVTGDVKFHTALDSKIVLFDVGHFESEILILPVFESLLDGQVEVVYADEKSPFKYLLDN